MSYLPKASPTFTGDPKAPTATAGDNDTTLATTGFVQNAIDTNIPDFARIYRNAAVTLASGSFVAVPFDAESTDAAGLHDNVTNNTRITVALDGVYLIHGSVAFAANATGDRIAAIEVDNTNQYIGERIPTVSGTVMRPNMSVILGLTAGQFVELLGFQNSGGNLALSVGNASETYLSLVRLGDI